MINYDVNNPFGFSLVTYPQYQIPQLNQMNRQYQSPANTGGQQLLRVNGIESAKMYPTSPNSSIALFDENEDVFYLKSTDASNFPTIRKFMFVEVFDQAPKPVETQYVTLEEFNKFKEELLNAKQSVRSESESTFTE